MVVKSSLEYAVYNPFPVRRPMFGKLAHWMLVLLAPRIYCGKSICLASFVDMFVDAWNLKVYVIEFNNWMT